MTRYEPSERATLEDIEISDWYQGGDVYTKQELAEIIGEEFFTQ
jgi:hypothetical protein